jgi:hypothetical protein
MVKITTLNCEKEYYKNILLFKPTKDNYSIKIEDDNEFSFYLKTKNNLKFNNCESSQIDDKKYIVANKKIELFENYKSKKKSIIIQGFKIHKEINNYDKEINNYDKEINNFCHIYNSTIDEIKSNAKVEFRYFCFRYLNYVRNITLPNIKLSLKNEAVLIEYRKFPHIEFILRNNINKLGNDWSHTVVCGTLNYDYVKIIVESISQNIKIIKTEYENLNQSTYSKFMASVEFWNLFSGEKILIYQEDSIIFKSNINDFINWDYIGAPWPKNQNDNINSVGNGGFSLRTKQCMIDVINKISLEDTVFESSTTNYMKNCGMTIGPEDVYFSLNMLRYGIGKVANWDSAYKFSSESFANPNSLGGHNFWINDSNWKKRLYSDIVIQFKPTYKTNDLEHRGGWKSVIENLSNNDLFNENSDFIFFDLIERYFLWDTNYICDKKWAGIIHCTQYSPPYLEIANISNLFKNINFINSLDNCVFIISLSNYVSEYLNEQFKKINKNIEIYSLHHPVYNDSTIPKFNLNNFINNKKKYLIQIGQQLRKMTSIYLVTIPNYKKMWLTGTKNIDKCVNLLRKEIIFLKIKMKNFHKVIMKYTDTFEEYDMLLTKNIVFVDLFDASANNTVLECILRNTPIVINKIPAIIEYLGQDYPLYFNDLTEVNDLLTPLNIKNAHEYLSKINKEKFELSYFTSKLVNIIQKNLHIINKYSININIIKNNINNNENISALVIKNENKKINYQIINCDNKNEIDRSLYVFDNMIKIIRDFNINIEQDKVIYHYKSDACSYNGNIFPLLSHSKKNANQNVILWNLTKNSSFVHWDLQEYLKCPDEIEWEHKENIFFFSGINSGNSFDNIEFPWFKNRSSRTKLLLESLKLNNKYKKMCKILFYGLENYDLIKSNIDNIDKLNELYGNLLKKDKKIEDLQNEIKIILNYVKPKIELKEIYKNKFIFCSEGFDVSAQLSWVLASNSVAICPPFEYENIIINPKELKPYVHYVPIDVDYSNLEKVIKWCLSHEEECKKINSNAKKYMKYFLDEDKMKEYHKDILLKIL